MVERLLAKEKVAGSNPVSRSLFGYLRKPGHLAQFPPEVDQPMAEVDLPAGRQGALKKRVYSSVG